MNTKKFSIWFCGIASLGLSTFTLVTYQPYASAATLDGTCNDLKNSAKQADNDAYASFLNSSCQSQILPQGTSFFRYYSFPPANDPFPNPIKPPGLNTTGRYLTTNFFDFNSEAIVKLALYPFTPAFQNFAYYRETVTLLQDTELYVGTVGPQLPNNPTSCYAGGAAQYYINAGVSNGGAGISPPDGTIFKYSDQEILPKIGWLSWSLGDNFC
jgi:hypothetical protein